jgi:hypothetical protein
MLLNKLAINSKFLTALTFATVTFLSFTSIAKAENAAQSFKIKLRLPQILVLSRQLSIRQRRRYANETVLKLKQTRLIEIQNRVVIIMSTSVVNNKLCLFDTKNIIISLTKNIPKIEGCFLLGDVLN